MQEIFNIASSISTPLALGGFFASILFFVFRQILKKNIFPSLTKSASAEIITLIIDRLFVLALVSMVLGFVGYMMPKPSQNSSTEITSREPKQEQGGTGNIQAGGDITIVNQTIEQKQIYDITKLKFTKFCEGVYAAPFQPDPDEPAFQFIIKWDFGSKFNESHYNVFLFTIGSDNCYYPRQQLINDKSFSLVNQKYHWKLKQSEVEKEKVKFLLVVLPDNFKFPELNPAGVYKKELKTFKNLIKPYAKFYCEISPNKLWKQYSENN